MRPWVSRNILVETRESGIPLSLFMKEENITSPSPLDVDDFLKQTSSSTYNHKYPQPKWLRTGPQIQTNDSALMLRVKHALAKLGLETYLTMLVDHNFIHSDLHPGNMFVQLPRDSNNHTHDFHHHEKQNITVRMGKDGARTDQTTIAQDGKTYTI